MPKDKEGLVERELQIHREGILRLTNMLIGEGCLTVEHQDGDDAVWRNIYDSVQALAARSPRLAQLEAENARLRQGLKQADEWLAGWQSAEPYRTIIDEILEPKP